MQAESLAAAGLLKSPSERGGGSVKNVKNNISRATAAAAADDSSTAETSSSWLTGVDVSDKLLKRARDIPGGSPYRDLRKADLNDPPALSKLGFPDDHFDAALCVGVLTYIDPGNRPDLLREMARVIKPGGAVVFTSRTDMAAAWEANAAALEAEGAWKLHARSEPMPYLPRNPDYAENIKVKVYAYVVLGGKCLPAA